LHDPEKYPEPLEFKPERFLKDAVIDPSVQDPNSAAFGVGRQSFYLCSNLKREPLTVLKII